MFWYLSEATTLSKFLPLSVLVEDSRRCPRVFEKKTSMDSIYFQKSDTTGLWKPFYLKIDKNHFLLGKLWYLACKWAIILLIEQKKFLQVIVYRKCSRINFLFKLWEKYIFWVRPKFWYSSRKHFLNKIKSMSDSLPKAEICNQSPLTAGIFPTNTGIRRYFAASYRALLSLFFCLSTFIIEKFWRKVRSGAMCGQLGFLQKWGTMRFTALWLTNDIKRTLHYGDNGSKKTPSFILTLKLN